MTFIGIIIIIVFVHFLIIRPLTQQNRQQNYEPRRNSFDYNQRNTYGPGGLGTMGGGIGRFGTFAGGLATGALLSYLFEQGRIGLDQFQAYQNLEDHELMRELADQNILQQEEIDQLQEEIGGNPNFDGGNDWNSNAEGENVDEVDYNQDDQQGQEDSGGWDNNSDDNWV